MKKLILSSVLMIVSFGVMFAQSDTTLDKTSYTLRDNHEGYITMKDGRMMISKNGRMTEMTSETVLTNGTRVTTNGKVIRPDGTTYMMKEGDKISMSGETKDFPKSKPN
jgi:hypothetical protein